MRFLMKPIDERVMQALAALAAEADGKVLIAFLAECNTALLTRSAQQQADVPSRWDQGAAGALAELVQAMQTALTKRGRLS